MLSYSLLLCGLFYEAIWFKSYLVLFCSCFYSPFSIARLPRMGKRELILVRSFRTFVPFTLVLFCLFPLPLSVWEGLWLVIVALPGLFLPFLIRYGQSEQNIVI